MSGQPRTSAGPGSASPRSTRARARLPGQRPGGPGSRGVVRAPGWSRPRTRV